MNDNVIHGGFSMPANSLVQTRIDSVIKEEASIVLQAIGLTVSDAVRLMLTRVAREKALPFEPLIPNEATIAAMKEAREGKLETVTLRDLQAVFDAND
jgi:DNA-damage-inducible protein J